MVRPIRYGKIIHYFEKKDLVEEEGFGLSVDETLDFKKYSSEVCEVIFCLDGSLKISCFGLNLKVPKGHWEEFKEVKTKTSQQDW